MSDNRTWKEAMHDLDDAIERFGRAAVIDPMERLIRWVDRLVEGRR